MIKKTAAANLLARLDRDRDQVIRFAHHFRVPFDNDLGERDIRMIKLQQKISGCWRTIAGAEQFLALRAYLSTARDPWIPATWTVTPSDWFKHREAVVIVLGGLLEHALPPCSPLTRSPTPC